MHYLGTYNQISYYLDKVNSGENYQPPTTEWATIKQSFTDPNKYAILQACPANGCPRTYTHSNMKLVKTLPAEFTPPQNDI